MSYPRYGDEAVAYEPYGRLVDEAERAEADRIAAQIMEHFHATSTRTKADVMYIAEALGRQDVSDAVFRWFSTKGD